MPGKQERKLLKKLDQVKGLRVNAIDGVKIWFDDKSAILIRPSGTEPVYRRYAEAKNPEKARKPIKEYSGKLEKILATT